MMFAVITPALISGAFAERMKFSAYVAFILLWSTLVYDPVAHWVWADGGWLFKMGALDFAGGPVVHLTAGMSALVCALVIGKRQGYPQERALPHNLTMTMTGAGYPLVRLVRLQRRAARSRPGSSRRSRSWRRTSARRGGRSGGSPSSGSTVASRPRSASRRASSRGSSRSRPRAGYVAPWAAIVIGIIASMLLLRRGAAKYKYGYDDSLDAFGVHGVGGLAGGAAHGRLRQKVLNDGGQRRRLFGNPHQLVVQVLACLATGLYAAVVTFGRAQADRQDDGLRVEEAEEREGLDQTQHGEEGYAG